MKLLAKTPHAPIYLEPGDLFKVIYIHDGLSEEVARIPITESKRVNRVLIYEVGPEDGFEWGIVGGFAWED